jgi:thioredoxin reductase (NADPH)
MLLVALLAAAGRSDDAETETDDPVDWNHFQLPSRLIDWPSLPVHDVIIVGSGPAGSTAALYLARAGYSPIVFHGHVAGGQLMMTHDVENFPAFSGTGPQLVRAIQSQAERAGAHFISDAISHASLILFPKQLTTDLHDGYRARAVVLATGANARFLGLKNEQRLRNRGVSACAVCDGPLYTNQSVAVVGGGDTAVSEALTLRRLCGHVTLITRGSNLTASLPMQTKFWQSGIDIVRDAEVTDVIGEDFVTGIQIRNVLTGGFRVINVAALFVAIGRIPATDVFKDEVEIDERGYFVRKGLTMETNVPGVFVAGDCADKMYRQAVTSAGTGCKAALDAEKWLIQQDETARDH